MYTYAICKNDKLYVVFSDNTEERTMHLIPEDQWSSPNGDYDAEYIICSELPYEEIVCTDTNLERMRQLQDGE